MSQGPEQSEGEAWQPRGALKQRHTVPVHWTQVFRESVTREYEAALMRSEMLV